MSERRIQAMIDALADERDRLAQEVDGFEAAVQANCVSSLLVALLIPGAFIMAAAARAACAIGNSGEIRRRVVVVEGVIIDIERLGDCVALVDPDDTAAVTRIESEVLATLAKVRRVSIVDDLLDSAAAAARQVLNAVKVAADVAGSIGTAILGVGVVGGLLYFFGSRRR